MVLTMEMLLTHAFLTSNSSAFIQILVMNSFTELKISVMKKCDYAGLFAYANNDAMDRFHLIIYIVACLM